MLSVPVDDRGYTLGHGLFETVLCVDGEPVWWDEHIRRLTRGCSVLRLPEPDPGQCLAVLREALDGALGRTAVRLNWSAGSGGRGLDLPEPPTPRLTASAAPAPKASGGVTLATASIARNDHSPASRLKTLAYVDNVLARAEARDAGADEALMLNSAGEIACAAVANIFWLADGALHTPALACGVLDGIARAKVIGLATSLGLDVREVQASREALSGRAAFLTNSLIGVRPVSKLDGRDCPSDPCIEAIVGSLQLP